MKELENRWMSWSHEKECGVVDFFLWNKLTLKQSNLFSTPRCTLYKPIFPESSRHPLSYDPMTSCTSIMSPSYLTLWVWHCCTKSSCSYDSLTWWLQWDLTLLLSSWNWQTWKFSCSKLAFLKIHRRLVKMTELDLATWKIDYSGKYWLFGHW